jgi:flagellar export protein FliJ
MRKFHFSLQAALLMRERAVEAAEIALKAVQDEWNANQRMQQDLVDEVRKAERQLSLGTVDPADLLALDRFREASWRRRHRLANEATQIARRLAEKRGQWQNAERDRTLLVRLKEKALARWNLEYDKEQQQLAEEAYLSRWHTR